MIYPLFQAAAEYGKGYTGAWAMMGAGYWCVPRRHRRGHRHRPYWWTRPLKRWNVSRKWPGRIQTAALIFAAPASEGRCMFAIRYLVHDRQQVLIS